MPNPAAGGATALLALTAQGPLNRSLRANAVERPADEGRAKSVLQPPGRKQRHAAPIPLDHDARRAR
ncbi:hypothetical protein ABZ329_27755 [Streptomyces rubiginosohelvolus]|uniref:hypothetical protein n=1 Tax=Streptomyces rubiginosohelvolus TaxID=67362 RepID=UPI0033CA3314